MDQKTIVLTGGTSGIGLEVVRQLCAAKWRIYLLARNAEKANLLVSLYPDQVFFVPCDLSDLASVASAVDIIRQNVAHIEVLMNNAGAWFMERSITKDGFEMTFASNHLGHFLLTTELLDLLLKSNSRVINVSSLAHRGGRLDFDDMTWERRKYTVIESYATSKLANVLFTRSLHDRYHDQGLSSFALHPGVVATNFGVTTSKWFTWLYKLAMPLMISPENGAKTQLMLATQSGLESQSGKYFSKSKQAKMSAHSRDKVLAERLWKYSEECVHPFRTSPR